MKDAWGICGGVYTGVRSVPGCEFSAIDVLRASSILCLDCCIFYYISLSPMALLDKDLVEKPFLVGVGVALIVCSYGTLV
jgi:hypothetical protein